MKSKANSEVKEQIKKSKNMGKKIKLNKTVDTVKTLKLSKENLKFSAAHFLIFDKLHAERLHGHNYQVQAEFAWLNSDIENNEYGFYVDFKILKNLLSDELKKWDEFILLPALCKEMKFKENGKSLEVKFRDRLYVFPKNEVILLPIVNTSVELLSELLCDNIWKATRQYKPCGIRVIVEETKGQGACSTNGQF